MQTTVSTTLKLSLRLKLYQLNVPVKMKAGIRVWGRKPGNTGGENLIMVVRLVLKHYILTIQTTNNCIYHGDLIKLSKICTFNMQY